MDDAPKYIIVEACSLECASVFNNVVDHSAVANGLNVVSAGFCSGLASDTPCPDEIVSGAANIYGDAVVEDEAHVSENAYVSGYAKIHGNAKATLLFVMTL